MNVATSLVGLGLAVFVGVSAAQAQPVADFDGPIATGPAALPASAYRATARARARPAPILVSPDSAKPAIAASPVSVTKDVETVTADSLSEAERDAAPDRTFELSPSVTLGSRPVGAEQASGGLLRSNPGLQRAERKNFGLSMKF